MRVRRSAAVVVGLLAGFAAAVVPASGPAAVPSAATTAGDDEPSHPLRWLALGDSYSSGEGVDENYGDCAQSPGAYAAEAYNQLRLEGFPLGDQDFLACSGAQIPDVTESVDLVEQIEQANGRYDLVTLSIGGNDAGFGDLVRDCLWRGCADERESLEAVEADRVRRIDAVRPSLFGIYGRIIDELLAPGGHVVVLGYPRLFEASSQWAWYLGNGCETFTKDEADMVRRLSDRIDGMIAGVAGAYDNVHFIDPRDAFEGHNLCAGWATTNEWINGLSVGWNSNRWPVRTDHSFHPNRDGHAAEAALLADVIRGLDWSGGRCVARQTLAEEAPSIHCQMGGDSELAIGVEWEGRDYVYLYIQPPPSMPQGNVGLNNPGCSADGGSKVRRWAPGEARPGTYQIWVVGEGRTADCSRGGPYRLSVGIDGALAATIDDVVDPGEFDKYVIDIRVGSG